MTAVRKITFSNQLRIIFMGVCLGAGSVWADTHTHTLTGFNDETDWTCTLEVSGDGVTFLQEDNEYPEDDHMIQKILYHVKRKATLTYTVQYLGATGTDPKYFVNGSEGATYSKTIELDRQNSHTTDRGVDALISWKEIHLDEDNRPVTNEIAKSCQFLPSIEFWKPLNVELRHTYPGNSPTLVSRIVTPAIVDSGSAGDKTITLSYSALGHVNVRVMGCEESAIKPASEEWFSTDENGNAKVTLLAPLDSDFENGRLTGSVFIKAVHDGMELEGNQSVDTYFAGVRYAEHVIMKDEFGQPFATLDVGDSVKKGQHIQIGTTLGAGSLELLFCNGESAWLHVDQTEGINAVIGDGELIEGATLLSLYIRNQLQEFKDSPRRVLRMQIYKELGGALDSALGVPGPVGVVTETPGGKLEKWLAQWGEKAYKTSPPPSSAQKQNATRIQSALAAPLIKASPLESETDTSSTPMNDAVRAEFSFQTDGTIYLENMGGNVQLALEDGADASVIAGASVMVIPARGDRTNSLISKAATSTTAWTAPTTTACLFSPTNGAVLSARTPAFSINTNSAPGLVLETARLLMDGNRVNDWFDLQSSPITGQVPVDRPLATGFHTLAFECLTLRGDWTEQAITFQVVGSPPVPQDIMTTVFSNGVWVSWQAVPAASGYTVWRAPSTNGTRMLLTSVLRQEPGFLDEAPLAENCYWIETRDALGQSAMPDTPVSCLWSNGLPSAPAVSAPEDIAMTATPKGVQITFDDFARDTTRWQLSRGSASNGTFLVLQTNDQTLVSGFVDESVLPGTNYYYKLTACTLDEISGQHAITNIVTGSIPSAPSGVVGMTSNSAVVVRWDRYSDFRATELRVYGYDGDAFALLATLPLNAVSYTDAQAGAANRSLYQVRAVGASGESSASSVGVDHYEITAENATINLPTEEIRVHEGDGVINIPVTRTGNLGESASIIYKVWHGNKSQAIEDVDFEKSAGTLTFTTGQTTAIIPVWLLTDSESEWAEGFSVDLGQGYGSTVAGPSWSADVIIEDSDLLMMADYSTEITVTETNGPVQVWIDRIWPSQHEVSVDVLLSDPAGSAIAGVDYTAFTTQHVTFAAGVSRQSFNLELLDDTLQDGTKTLDVHLQNPEGGASIDASFNALTINIRDDDIHPGQFTFQATDNIMIAEPGTNSIHIPVVREGGTDGAISASLFMESGTLPWGGISFTPISASEGQNSTTLTATLNRTGLDSNIAPFCVVSLANDEFPNESHQIVLVFRHEGSPASPFASWITGYDVGSTTGALDNADQDGANNIMEYALGTEPDSEASYPILDVAIDSTSFTIDAHVSPEPNLAIVAEFRSDLTSSDRTYDAGWWSWQDTTRKYDVNFYKALTGAASQFGRVRLIWVGE